jgi:hypothetical protein
MAGGAAEPAPVAPVPVSAGPTTEDTAPRRRADWPAGTPIWLLDVDGVLNAVTRRPDRRVWNDYRSGWATARQHRWPITWSPTVVTTIADLHAARAVEVLWLTTWEDDANGDLIDLLGMPRLPVAGRSSDPDVVIADGWWKLHVAQRIHRLAPDRRIVWTDDDLDYDSRAARWIRGAGLGVSPDTAHGLDSADLDRVRAFLDGRTA